MKPAKVTSFMLAAAAAIALQAGAAQAAMKTQWIDYKQGQYATPPAIWSMTMPSRASARPC